MVHPDPRDTPTPGASDERLAVLRDADTREQVRTLESGLEQPGSSHFDFSPDGRWLARSQNDSGVDLWEVRTGDRTGSMSTGKGGILVCFRPRPAIAPDNGGAEIASQEAFVLLPDGNTSVRRVPDLAEARVLQSPVAGAHWIGFNSDGSLLAVGTLNGDVWLADPDSGRVVRSWRDQPAAGVTNLSFSRDGGLLAVCRTGAAQLWEVSSGRLVGSIEGDVRFVLFDRSSKISGDAEPAGEPRLFMAMGDGWLRIVGVMTLPDDGSRMMSDLLPLRYQTGSGWVRELSQSADGTRLLATRDAPATQYYIWDTKPAAAQGRADVVPGQ